MWHCEPPAVQEDMQLEGAGIGEMPTVAGCFAMALCTTGLALWLQGSQTTSVRLHGDARWDSDLLKIRK